MICNKCSNKSFCKHYDFIVNAHALTLRLEECDNFESKYTINKAIDDLSVKTMPINPSPVVDSDVSFGSKLYPDLREEYIPPIIKNLATNVEISKATCDRCKKEVLSTEIDNCVECGRPVCRDCGVGALNNGKPEFTCEKCWSGTPDPDPNNPEEVVITYGEEKSEWDIEDFKQEQDTNAEVKEEKHEPKKQMGTKSSDKKLKGK